MIPSAFDYHSPGTLEEAIGLLRCSSCDWALPRSSWT